MAKPKIVTPVGTVKFPNIGRPKENGKYGIALVLEPTNQEYIDMMAKIEEYEKDFEKKFRGQKHVKPNIDLVDGEKVETKQVLMQFNSAYPLWEEDGEGSKVFDAKGTPIKQDIGWGSKVRVSFTLSPYDVSGKCGVTKYISGIQIIELSTAGTTSKSCGFKEEDGYINANRSSEELISKPVNPEDVAWDD